MKFILVSAALAGMLAVILGAFAAHGLKGHLSESLLNTFQTAVQYQMYHALAVILVVVLYRYTPDSMLVWSAGFMLVGILLFSGSLYALSLSGIKWFGPITPAGGLCFIIGWGLLIFAALRSQGATS